MLKNLNKDKQRYIMRHFNFSIQLSAMTAYLIKGNIQSEHIPYLAILVFSVSIPAIFGAKLFYKISDTQFKKVVLGLLFTSGIFMCLSLLT